MKTEKLFFASNYLLIFLSISPLLLSDKFGFYDSVFVGGLLLACGILELRGLIPLFSRASSYVKYLVIAAIVLLMFTQQDKYLLLVWLTMFFLLSKLIVKKDFTDHLLIYVLTLVLLLFGAVVVVEFYFSLIFLAYFFTITWCLLFYHFVQEQMEEKASIRQRSDKRLHKEALQSEPMAESFFWSVNGIITLSLVFTLMVYFIFPRISSGFLKIDIGDSGLFTGFSDEVSLGEIGTINEDNSVAFRAEIYSSSKKVKLAVPQIYWWGKSLDHYEDNRWSDTIKGRVPLKQKGYGTFYTPFEHKGRIYSGKFYVLPFHSNVLFYPFTPLRVEMRERQLYTPHGGGLNLARYEYKSLNYSLTFSLNDERQSYPYILPKGYIPEKNLFEKYLHIDEYDSKLHELAQEITAQHTDPLHAGKLLEGYFRSNFTYTLEYEDREGMTPLHYFLFKSKAGHCEYFSTAMTLMLRHLGIPARIVNGFAGGEWSEMGEYYIVRKRNAHSWVEVFHDGQWFPFDPTPRVFQSQSDKSFFDRTSYYVDFAKLKWNQYFILYSWKDQINIGMKLGSQGHELRHAFNSLLRASIDKGKIFFERLGFGTGSQWVILLLLSGAGGLVIMLSFRLFRNYSYSIDPRKRVSHSLIRKLRKLGIEKHTGETFYECYQRNKGAIDAAEGLREEIVRYYRLRFG